MKYFDTPEEAEQGYASLLKATMTIAIGHQCTTAQMVGSLTGMAKYFTEVGDDNISDAVMVEYASLNSMIRLRMKELIIMQSTLEKLDIPDAIGVDIDKLSDTLNKYITRYSDITYNNLKYGSPAEVTKNIMDIININKSAMGLDTEEFNDE